MTYVEKQNIFLKEQLICLKKILTFFETLVLLDERIIFSKQVSKLLNKYIIYNVYMYKYIYIYTTKVQIEKMGPKLEHTKSYSQKHLSKHAHTFPPSYLPLVPDALHDEIGPKAVRAT